MNALARWLRSETLFSRTALALAVAFVLFGVAATVLLQLTLVKPHTRQAADDLASFLLLSSQIWVELPPFTRSDFERELLQRHDIRILAAEAPSATQPASNAYIRYLETSLSRLVDTGVVIHSHPDYPGWLWADLPVADRVLRLGFRETRLHDRILIILPFLTGIGLFAAFAVAILLVRYITRPLAQISAATQRIGKGDFSIVVPETGPRELAALAGKLNQMERQIEQLLANRTTLLAGISHDLRTPLARMRLELEMLDHEGRETLIDGLNDDISEMENLIRHALWLAKGIGREEAIEADVWGIVRFVVDGYLASGMDIISNCEGSYVRPVQREALTRVVSNLIENASLHSGGRKVSVTCRRADAAIEICVLDEGPGIPVSERDKIFQPFYRVEQSRNKATGGSGLGLAIVAQLCQALGWEIKVSSRADRSGSVFCLGLPEPDIDPRNSNAQWRDLAQ